LALATSKRVNSARSIPNQLFARGLSVRTNDLNALLDTMSTGIGTIQAASNGISAVTKLVQSAQALVSQAQQTADTTVRATLASQFDALLPQIDQLAGNSGLNGINLLAGNDLTITMNEDGTSIVVVTAFNDTAAGDLAINSSPNNWATGTDISTAGVQLTTALMTLRSQAQTLSSNLAVVQIREDFTKAMINMLNNSADSPTFAYINDEGANLLALQTRQQTSTTVLSLAAQADQNVLRLFRKAQQPDASQAVRLALHQL
jgi:flagellin